MFCVEGTVHTSPLRMLTVEGLFFNIVTRKQCVQKCVQELIQTETLMQDASLVHATRHRSGGSKKDHYIFFEGISNTYVLYVTLSMIRGQKRARVPY